MIKLFDPPRLNELGYNLHDLVFSNPQLNDNFMNAKCWRKREEAKQNPERVIGHDLNLHADHLIAGFCRVSTPRRSSHIPSKSQSVS